MPPRTRRGGASQGTKRPASRRVAASPPPQKRARVSAASASSEAPAAASSSSPSTVDVVMAKRAGPKEPATEQEAADRAAFEAALKDLGDPDFKLPAQPDDNWKSDAGRKRPAAIMFSYLGTGFSGLQVQRNDHVTQTIEQVIWDTLFRVGAVSADNFQDPSKVKWQRACRTDKGVHAAGNVLSLKVLAFAPTATEMLNRINAKLPRQIRAIALIRTTKGFSSYTMCTDRTYEYVLPTHAFEDLGFLESVPGALNLVEGELSREEHFERRARGLLHADDPAVVAERNRIRDEITEQIKQPHVHKKLMEYRVSPERLERANKVLARFEGTRRMHNFTVGREGRDPGAQRFIRSCSVTSVFLQQGMEFARIRIDGQSFLLHQIRMIVGTAVAVIRGRVPDTYLDDVFYPDKRVFAPRAPPTGLFLERCYFRSYNKKLEDRNDRELIDFAKFDDHIEWFKRERIYPVITSTEVDRLEFATWLAQLIDGVRARFGPIKPETDNKAVKVRLGLISQDEVRKEIRSRREIREKRKAEAEEHAKARGENPEGKKARFDRRDRRDIDYSGVIDVGSDDNA